MKNWIMLNMFRPLHATLFFSQACLRGEVYITETTFSQFDCIKIKPK